MDYTSLIRQAHINSLKQKYLDIIEEAKKEKESRELEYLEQAQKAYAEREKSRIERPQQLRAAGISGGAEERELDGIDYAYDESMDKLEKRRREYLGKYLDTVERQTRLMNNSLSEYNAKIALEDYNKTLKTGKTASSSSADNTAAQEKATTEEPEIYEGVWRKRMDAKR